MYLIIHNSLFDFLENRPRRLLFVASLLLALVMGALNYLLGMYSLTILFVIPIFLSSWFVGKRHGFFTAFVCAVTNLVSSAMGAATDVDPAIFFGGTAIHGCYMFLLGLMFSTLKGKLENEVQMARIDPLTNALTRRGFYELAEYELSKSRRYSRPITFAYLDLDNFKEINDTLGHGAGDRLLSRVADAIRKNTRETDTVARVGGDEFVIMLTETNPDSAKVVIDKLRSRFHKEMEKEGLPVSFSMGVVSCLRASDPLDDILVKADSLMYAVKSNGKNAIRYEILACPTM